MTNNGHHQMIQLELFKDELSHNCTILQKQTLLLENDSTSTDLVDNSMRAIHSIKGAANIIQLLPISHLAHALESLYESIRETVHLPTKETFDAIYTAIDILKNCAQTPADKLFRQIDVDTKNIEYHAEKLKEMSSNQKSYESKKSSTEKLPLATANKKTGIEYIHVSYKNIQDIISISSDMLSRSKTTDKNLFHLAEIERFNDALNQLLNQINTGILLENPESKTLDIIQEALDYSDKISIRLVSTLPKLISDFSLHNEQALSLYERAIETRLRPFWVCTQNLPRLVRDIAIKFDKRIDLNIVGNSVMIDRDTLSAIKSPINHLIYNACDHGIESPEHRKSLGKSSEGTITVTASQSTHSLYIQVKDDGAGIDYQKVAAKALALGMISATELKNFSDNELLEFIFLPKFSTASRVTSISGRGMGLYSVYSAIHELSGSINVSSSKNEGTTYTLHFPPNKAVIQAILFVINHCTLSLPLSYVDGIQTLDPNNLIESNSRLYYKWQGNHLPIITDQDLFAQASTTKQSDYLLIIIKYEATTLALRIDHCLQDTQAIVQSDNVIPKQLSLFSAMILTPIRTKVIPLINIHWLLALQKSTL